MTVSLLWVFAAFAAGILLGLPSPRNTAAESRPRPWPRVPGSEKTGEPFTCDFCLNENRVRDSFLARNIQPPPRRPTPPPSVWIHEGSGGRLGRECSHCKHVFHTPATGL